MTTNSRRAAAFVFARWRLTGEFPSALLPEGRDRAFVQDLVYTAIRRMRPLRRILGELVKKWPKGELESLLMIGAAQIFYMPEVPDFAAVNETVNGAKACGNPAVAKVVNGVLRNLIRRREEFELMISAMPVEERESYPTALYRRWAARFGAERAETIAKWHNEPAETYLAYSDGRFEKAERGKKITEIEGFEDGAFIVQDPGTAHAVEMMAVKHGERVLDACAAPGGKTIQLAWRGAVVTASEMNPARRKRLEENLARAKVQVTVLADIPDGDRFCKVLVDAPCSNTGVLRRRPDARWNWSERKLGELVKLQAAILDRAAALVEPGGWLVYSTCSNESDENDGQVAEFLARHAEFSLEKSLESVPDETGHDGAFAARMVRKV